MKPIFLFIFLISALTGIAEADSDNFNQSSTTKMPITLEELRNQLEIVGEIFVFDSTGSKLLFQADEVRYWKFGSTKPIKINWSYKQPDLPEVALRVEIGLTEQGHLQTYVQQYDSILKTDDGVTHGKFIREDKFTMKHFEPIVWTIGDKKGTKVVARLTPTLSQTAETLDIGRLPISGSRFTIYDNKGNVWAMNLEDVKAEQFYVGFQTHLGSVYISYVPFEGAAKIGTAYKDRIVIHDSNQKIFIESADPLLPKGVRANVYGIVNRNSRTKGLHSVHTQSSNTEARFLKHVKSK